MLVDWLQHPCRQLSDLLDKIYKEFGVTISRWTLRNVLKSLGFVWKRIRKSLKRERDELSFYKFQKRLKRWQKQVDKGKLDLYFFDESGFNLTPNVPYAWQKKGECFEVFSQKGANYTVLGFVNKQMDFHPYLKEGSAKSVDVICCIDDFTEEIRKGKSSKHKTVIVLDNAPIHRSRKFQDRIKYWKRRGVQIVFLPPYSPELNLIEILWRFIKYKWLPFKAYSCKQSLFNELVELLNNIGSCYRINFS